MSITIVRPFLLLPAFASFSLFHIGAPIVGQGDYQVSPDGTHVVFSGDRDVHNVTELYSVKSTGGPIVKLSGPFPPATHDEVVDFRISPDGRTVVYLAEQAFHDRFELFSVPIEGGVPVRIGSPFINQGDVLMQTGPDAFEIGLDGTQVIYIADQQVNERFELFAAPIHGGPSVRLNRALAAGCDVRDFLISPDRKRVLFHADHLVQHDVELFSASLGGPPRAVRLSDFLQFVPFDRGGSIVSPDGKWVVYARDDPDPLDEVESFAVRVVPADGSGPPIELEAGEARLGAESITPDGARVVYAAFQVDEDILELFGAPIDGSSAPVPISQVLNLPGGLAGPFARFQISPDGGSVAYLAETTEDQILRLFSAPVDGSASPVELNGPLVPGGSVREFPILDRIVPDGSRIVYLADQDLLGVVEVYSAPLEGGSEPIRLAPGVAVSWFDLGPDRVVFTVPGDNVSRAKLLSVPFDGSQSAVDLSKSSPVNRVSISPQGTHVLFLASGGLYSVPIDGRKAPILIVASS